MNYKVLNDFIEKHHNNTVYRKGDIYPKEGFKANQSRVSFLQKAHHTYGVPFLEKTIEENEPQELKKQPGKPKKSGDK